MMDKQKYLIFHPHKCVACKTCMLACSMGKTGKCSLVDANVNVVTFDEEGFYSPVACFQCEEAWCMAVCPAGAISVDPDTGAKIVDEHKCVACRMCTVACPFGNVRIRNGKSKKCDLCDGDPRCVRFCPTHALTYETLADSTMRTKTEMVHRVMLDSLSHEPDASGH